MFIDLQDLQDLFVQIMTTGEHYTKKTPFDLLKTIGHQDIEALNADPVFNIIKPPTSIRVFKPTSGPHRTV